MADPGRRIGFGDLGAESSTAETTVSSTAIPEPTDEGPANRRAALAAAAVCTSAPGRIVTRDDVTEVAEHFEAWLNRTDDESR